MANTHTESNITSSMMTGLYKQSKIIIKEHVNADKHDVVIQDGFGMTSVVNKLQRILGYEYQRYGEIICNFQKRKDRLFS